METEPVLRHAQRSSMEILSDEPLREPRTNFYFVLNPDDFYVERVADL